MDGLDDLPERFEIQLFARTHRLPPGLADKGFAPSRQDAGWLKNGGNRKILAL
jgi:hypothetical protein